jgi:hypothetical protein
VGEKFGTMRGAAVACDGSGTNTFAWSATTGFLWANLGFARFPATKTMTGTRNFGAGTSLVPATVIPAPVVAAVSAVDSAIQSFVSGILDGPD